MLALFPQCVLLALLPQCVMLALFPLFVMLELFPQNPRQQEVSHCHHFCPVGKHAIETQPDISIFM